MPWFQKPIALTPAGGGGVCIDASALQPADIIISTTRAVTSEGIRIFTGSTVSHAALYAGGGDVIEAIGTGVTKHALTQALQDDVLAVAYRAPGMTAVIADRIIKYASSNVGRPYSLKGAVLSQSWILCRLIGPNPATFFCSQLVLEAFKQGGLPLTTTPSQCMAPSDVANIAQSQLIYVGHLLGDPAWLPVIDP